MAPGPHGITYALVEPAPLSAEWEPTLYMWNGGSEWKNMKTTATYISVDMEGTIYKVNTAADGVTRTTQRQNTLGVEEYERCLISEVEAEKLAKAEM